MKFTLLPCKFENQYFYISPITGNLNVTDTPVFMFNINDKIKKALWYCDNPYELNQIDNISAELNNYLISKLKIYNKRLIWLNNKRFLLSCIYSRISVPLFNNTVQAFDFIAELNIHKEKKGKICLQRSLLAAKISKSFKKNGTLFIGAQLPTGVMHAWIIENGIQPDRQDREWIMYKPLLAITF